jgi:hypothetical protein
MIKQTLTPERKEKVFSSVQFMALMAEMIQIEHGIHMDVDFKRPQINNFASRISKDAAAILLHLQSDPKVQFKNADKDFTFDYALELHRIFQFFIGFPIEKIREYLDGIEKMREEELK